VYQRSTEIGKRLAFVLNSSCQSIKPLETLDFFGVA
jgi:hypothetical protein